MNYIKQILRKHMQMNLNPWICCDIYYCGHGIKNGDLWI
jgi:hypothetical protein